MPVGELAPGAASALVIRFEQIYNHHGPRRDIDVTDEANDGTDVTGTSVAAFHGRMNSYTIADLEFPQQACVIVDLSGINAHLDEPMRFALGLPQIVLANWYLDFRTQTLAVYPLA